MENGALSATVEPPDLGGEGGIVTAPTVYLSARGQDTALLAAVVKARLESQGCLVQHGSAEVRTRSQCAKYYGPLLHDCDVFIQLVGVDPGPVLSSEDEDDFWSLQIWEAREAARRKKPARHYLLDEKFCRMMLPDAKRPPQVLKKQERHRRKLASSPAKVRQVQDADELLRLLPIIRLAGDSPENFSNLDTGETFNAELEASLAAIAAQVTSAAEPVSRDNGTLSEVPPQETSLARDVSVSRQVLAPAEVKEDKAAAPATERQSSSHEKGAEHGVAAISMGAHGGLSPLPAIPDLPERDEPVAGTPVRFESRREDPQNDGDGDAHFSLTELPHTLPEVSLFNAESKNRETVRTSLPPAFVLETGSVLPPIPALPAAPEELSSRPGGDSATASPASDIQLGNTVEEKNPEVAAPPASVVASEIVSGETVPPIPVSKEPAESTTALAEAIATSSNTDEPVVAGSKAFADTAENSPQAPSTTPTAATAVVMEKASPAPVDGQPDQPKEPAVGELSFAPKEKLGIEVRASRMEIVAQAPMKLELCRVEGHRVSVRPYARERRGLPRRGLPAWMLKKSTEHSSPVKPVPGRRAYAKPSPAATDEFQDESEQSFEETLFIPHRPVVRKYQHQRFIIFRITDSVSVRRLGEASKRKPGVAIATVLGVVVLTGLLTKLAVDFLHDGTNPAVASVTSDDPALAAPSRLDISAESRKQNTATPKPKQPGIPVSSQPQGPVLATITPASGMAGTDPKPTAPESALASAPAEAPIAAPAPIPAASTRQIAAAPVGNLDEQQKSLEKELQEAILAMRNASSASMYARQHEATIMELQRKLQELIPVRSGHGFSGSESSLSLSRCLASVHLLGGRRQAARNVLLDMRDMIATTRSADAAEIRLADYLLKLTETPSESSQATLPLTPEEMKALLTKFGSDPQWEPPVDGSIAGDS